VAFQELKERVAAAWSSAPWEEAEHQLGEAHERLVDALEPKSGERWLDVATGTGAVALRMARRGADVAGLDIAPGLIETARRRAAEEGLAIRFDVGDAEALPYEDGSFDGVASSFGVIFAPRHEVAARELARVLRPGGRLGFTAWRPDAGFFPTIRKYAPPPPEGAGDSDDWGRDEYVERMLGGSFDLRLEPGTSVFEAESGEAQWDLSRRSVGPFKTGVAMLEPDRLAAFHEEFVSYFEAHRERDRVRVPADYLLVLGTRR
jgi:SAM-dependent methyltransferase